MERLIIAYFVRAAVILMPWWDLGSGIAFAAAAMLSLASARGRWRPIPVDLALWSGFAAIAASALWTSAPSFETLLRWSPLIYVPLAMRRQHRAWSGGLIAGGILLALGLLGNGIVQSIKAESLRPFLYRDFAEFAHQHSYLTLYLGLAAAALSADTWFPPALRRLTLLLFALVVLLAGSRMGIAAVSVGALWWYLGRTTLRAVLPKVLAACALIAVFLVILPSERGLGKFLKADPYWATGSVDSRVVQAKAAWRLIEQQPLLGHGVDRVQPELDRVYRDWNYRFGIKRQLNVHNQFLQLWAGIGLWGMGIWLIGLAYCANKLPWNRGAQALAITVLLLLLTESMLERAMGIALLASAMHQSLPRGMGKVQGRRA
ncbi:MAG: O-antigen ligase family protein [Cryomorphaceae bacterium]|nr:O-antigen ligase family protein [Cryomorphaceae bacterium]